MSHTDTVRVGSSALSLLRLEMKILFSDGLSSRVSPAVFSLCNSSSVANFGTPILFGVNSVCKCSMYILTRNFLLQFEWNLMTVVVFQYITRLWLFSNNLPLYDHVCMTEVSSLAAVRAEPYDCGCFPICYRLQNKHPTAQHNPDSVEVYTNSSRTK